MIYILLAIYLFIYVVDVLVEWVWDLDNNPFGYHVVRSAFWPIRAAIFMLAGVLNANPIKSIKRSISSLGKGLKAGVRGR